MNISPQAVSDLAALTQAIDDPDIDLLKSLDQLAEQVRLAVPSYLGVSVSMTTSLARVVTIDLIEDGDASQAVRSSLRIPAAAALGGADPRRPDRHPHVTLVLYAGVPGALVDLAADLGWLTGLSLEEFALDQHLAGPQDTASTLNSASLADQAIGVLLGRGHTPEEASRILDARAATGTISRQRAAAAILDEVTAPVERRDQDPFPSL